MKYRKNLKTEIIFLVTSILIIFFWKLQSFQDIIFNVDEIEWIYCLNKCYINPIPFEGFDAHTSGPLAIYLLIPLKFIAQTVSLTSLRLYAFLVFVLPTIFFVFYTFKGVIKYFAVLLFISMHLIFNKDFFAYNTEYPILMFISIIMFLFSINKLNFRIVSIILILIFCLPFIKFQALIFSLFFAILLMYKIFIFQRSLFLKSVLLASIISLLILLLLHFFVGVDLFYYSYITRNVQYASSFSNKSWFIAVVENIYKHIDLFASFYLLLSILLFMYVRKYFDRIKLKSFKLNSDFFFRLFTFFGLFFVAFLSVLAPKNNFIHYYTLMFIPLTYLIVYLAEHIKISSMVILLLFLLINSNVVSYANELLYSKYIKGSYNNKLLYEKYTLDQKINKDIDLLLKKYTDKNKSIVVLGWFNALPIYYMYKENFNFPYRSGHADFLVSSSKLKDTSSFKTEYQNLLTDITSNKTLILDVENVFLKISSEKINNYLRVNYEKVDSESGMVLYVPKY
jgi:hypothetical protein